MSIDSLFEEIQEATLKAIWSQGISLSKGSSLILEKKTDTEIVFKINTGKLVLQKVSLWPKDDDYFCECGDKNDPCPHVVAAVLLAKHGTLETKTSKVKIIYNFLDNNGFLELERIIDNNGEKIKLTESLVSIIGGIDSGRVKLPNIPSTKEDFIIDEIIGNSTKIKIEDKILPKLFKALENCNDIYFNNENLKITENAFKPKAVLENFEDGFIIRGNADFNIIKFFKNNLLIGVSNNQKILAKDFTSNLNETEKECITKDGKIFKKDDVYKLIQEILPILKSKIFIEIKANNLPELVQIAPEPAVLLEKDSSGRLIVKTYLEYQNYAKVINGEFIVTNAKQIISRNLNLEKETLFNINKDLDLRLHFYSGESAIRLTEKIKTKNYKITDKTNNAFTVVDELQVNFDKNSESFIFKTQSENKEFSLKMVLDSFQNNQNYLLTDFGAFKLPVDFLEKYGERLLNILENKNTIAKIETLNIANEVKADIPFEFNKLNNLASGFFKLNEYKLPTDLKANLREYQLDGFNFISILKEHNLGGILADDMGLGKTLQAILAITGKTLIVAPRSVLECWGNQIEKFRPSLKYTYYHGSNRNLYNHFKEGFDVIITTYGVLRQDVNILTDIEFDNIYLDESQNIKNPDSQVSRAAYDLKAKFKLALSGTPIENKLTDLWSVFNFINTGFLGSLSNFKSNYAERISFGDTQKLNELKSKIKPFVLRRLKKDVAKDLPPKIESELYVELNEAERESYNTLYATTKAEIEKALFNNKILTALDLLLKLRQTCVDLRLVKGTLLEKDNYKTSSKTEILIEKLEEAIEDNHKSLIFSQWTSYLDLLEIALKEKGISFLRIDGSTQNRDEVVQKFQNESTHMVMLISLKAGGTGLTLTAADTVFITDPWWNPFVENQAADRAHRIGQTNSVLIYRILAKDTLEEKILMLQEKKKEIAEAMLSETGEFKGLTKEDILSLI